MAHRRPNEVIKDMKHINPFEKSLLSEDEIEIFNSKVKNTKPQTNFWTGIKMSGMTFSNMSLLAILEMLGFLVLVSVIICAFFCAFCPLCFKEGTIYGRRVPLPGNIEQQSPVPVPLLRSMSMISAQRFQSLQVSLPPGKYNVLNFGQKMPRAKCQIK